MLQDRCPAITAGMELRRLDDDLAAGGDDEIIGDTAGIQNVLAHALSLMRIRQSAEHRIEQRRGGCLLPQRLPAAKPVGVVIAAEADRTAGAGSVLGPDHMGQTGLILPDGQVAVVDPVLMEQPRTDRVVDPGTGQHDERLSSRQRILCPVDDVSAHPGGDEQGLQPTSQRPEDCLLYTSPSPRD